jgi:hypothetical protein
MVCLNQINIQNRISVAAVIFFSEMIDGTVML